MAKKTNAELAEIFIQYADHLENEHDNPYRVKAYRRAGNAINRSTINISNALKKNPDFDLTEIPYIGRVIASQLKELISTGDFTKNYDSKSKKIKLTPGKAKQKSFKIYSAIPFLEHFIFAVEKIPGIEQLAYAGNYRRRMELVNNIEIIAQGKNPKKILAAFMKLPEVKYIVEQSDKKISVEVKFGLTVTLHIASPTNFGAMLLYYTGSASHYEALQKLAKKKNLILKQQGLYINKKYIAGVTEEDIYQRLKLQYIEPELRENRGEIQLALKHKLPELIKLENIRGDLHVHTKETDGTETIFTMVEKAIEYGYEYIAITDHSKRLKITNGMDEKRLLKQIKEIDKLNENLTDFTILKSIEVDILEDGSLDLSNDVLKELDLCVCSVHSKFNLPGKKQTERIIRAMENPYFNILGHATGRLIHHRPAYEVDLEKVFQAAKANGCIIELNSQPARLDINDVYCQQARAMGLKISISSDAHTLRGFSFMSLGINQARRGWLTAKDVINTYPLSQLRKLLKRK